MYPPGDPRYRPPSNNFSCGLWIFGIVMVVGLLGLCGSMFSDRGIPDIGDALGMILFVAVFLAGAILKWLDDN